MTPTWKGSHWIFSFSMQSFANCQCDECLKLNIGKPIIDFIERALPGNRLESSSPLSPSPLSVVVSAADNSTDLGT